MRGLYQQSVSAAPLTVARRDEDSSERGGGGGAAAAGEQQQQRPEGRMEVIELADGRRVVLPRGLSAAEEEQLRQKQQKPTVHIEKVVNAWGSAAGAGSDFFDCYRRTRNVELRRVEKMEEEFRKKVETEEFQLQRHRRIEEAAQKNAAARERRRRRKMKRQEQQQSRLNVKKSDPAAAAATGDDSSAGAVAVDNNDSRTISSSSNNNSSNNSRADASASVSAEAHTKNTGITHAEDRTALGCPTDEIKRVRHSSKKEQRNGSRGDGDEGEEEEDGGEDGASVCSEEGSESTKCGAQEENDAAQSPGRKKRRQTGDTTEKKHSPAPAQIHQCKVKSEKEEKDRQLGTAASTEVTGRVNTEEEEEEEPRLPVMKAGMITVRDDDW